MSGNFQTFGKSFDMLDEFLADEHKAFEGELEVDGEIVRRN